MPFAIDALTYAVNGFAMKVHSEFGPGIDEICYHSLLCEKLTLAGIEHQFKPSGRLIHRGFLADEFEADIICAEPLVIECKMARGECPPAFFTQLFCYQKFWKIPTGLLLNFGNAELQLHRRFFHESEIDQSEITLPAPLEQNELACAISRAILAIRDTYGYGYRGTSYQGLVWAELCAEKIQVEREPVVQIVTAHKARPTSLNCLLVQGCVPLVVVALQDEIGATDRAIMQTYLRLLEAPWGVIANFGKKQLDVRFVVRKGIAVPDHQGMVLGVTDL